MYSSLWVNGSHFAFINSFLISDFKRFPSHLLPFLFFTFSIRSCRSLDFCSISYLLRTTSLYCSQIRCNSMHFGLQKIRKICYHNDMIIQEVYQYRGFGFYYSMIFPENVYDFEIFPSIYFFLFLANFWGVFWWGTFFWRFFFGGGRFFFFLGWGYFFILATPGGSTCCYATGYATLYCRPQVGGSWTL